MEEQIKKIYEKQKNGRPGASISLQRAAALYALAVRPSSCSRKSREMHQMPAMPTRV